MLESVSYLNLKWLIILLQIYLYYTFTKCFISMMWVNRLCPQNQYSQLEQVQGEWPLQKYFGGYSLT